MRVGLHRGEIVDPDDLDVLAIGFGDRAQHVAADAAKTVDGNANPHSSFALLRLNDRSGGRMAKRICLLTRPFTAPIPSLSPTFNSTHNVDAGTGIKIDRIPGVTVEVWTRRKSPAPQHRQVKRRAVECH